MDLHGGAHATLERAAFERSTGAALIVAEAGTTLGATDLSVGDTASRAPDGRAGYGLDVYGGASADVSNARIARSHGAGVVVSDAATTATFSALEVEDVDPQGCVADGCSGGGSGLCVLSDAAADVTHFRISGGALCGVQIAQGGVLDLHDGEVSHNLVGANVQTAGFDVTRLEDDVAYVDNERTLDATVLPLPEPLDGI
jgi:hypothetical protein